MGNKEKLYLIIGLAIGLFIYALPLNIGYVIYPIYGMTLILLISFVKLNQLDNRNIIFDIGALAILSSYIYSIYPLINYIAGGFNFGVLSDNRLSHFNITSEGLGVFHLRHLLYVLFLSLAYLKFRKKSTIDYENFSKLKKNDILALLSSLFSLYFALSLISLFTNFDLGHSSYDTEQRALLMKEYYQLPLIIRQITAKIPPILFIAKILLIYWVISNKPKYLLLILITFLLYEATDVFINKSGRSALIFYCIAITLLYSRLINNVSIKKLIIFGVIIFTFFNFIGIYRALGSIENYYQNIFSNNFLGLFVVGNEFQSLLGTEYNVYIWVKQGIKIPISLYFNDFISIFPPQQFLPFAKLGGAEWYLDVYGISGTGQGYMWGVITQAIIGFDWFEICIRGMVLGGILAAYHNWYFLNQKSYLATIFYVYLCIKIYNTFRDTTFIFLVNLVWEIIPFFLIFKFYQFIFNLNYIKSDKIS